MGLREPLWAIYGATMGLGGHLWGIHGLAMGKGGSYGARRSSYGAGGHLWGIYGESMGQLWGRELLWGMYGVRVGQPPRSPPPPRPIDAAVLSVCCQRGLLLLPLFGVLLWAAVG